MLLLQCPRCRNTMKYQPAKLPLVDGKVKRCVYCGRIFGVRKAVVNILS